MGFKKKQNKLIVDPTHFGDRGFDMPYNSIIDYTKNNLPKWWKNLTPNTIDKNTILDKLYFNHKEKGIEFGVHSYGLYTAKSCPSFIELFKNSYIIKAPCEMFIEIDAKNKQWRWMSTSKDLFSIDSHDLQSQLQWGNEYKNILNLKFELKAGVKTTKYPYNVIYMDPLFYNNFKLRMVPGILPLIPNYMAAFNLHFYLNFDDFKDRETIHIKEGDVLSILYCPEGILEIKEQIVKHTPRTNFIGDYLKSLNRFRFIKK